MRKVAFLSLLCCLSFLAADAQDAKKAIRDHYAAVKERLAEFAKLEAEGETYPVNECYKVKIKQNLPGTGLHEEEVLMIYAEVEGEDEVYPDHRLEYVSSSYNFAARKFYQEFLFDQGGHVTFIYAFYPDLDDGKEYELRLYFSKGKLFDALVKSRKIGGKDFSTDYSGKTLPLRFQSYYHQYADDVAKYGRLFDAIEGATHR